VSYAKETSKPMKILSIPLWLPSCTDSNIY